MNELDNCVICLDTIQLPKKLDCGHKFCESCIVTSFKSWQPKCPSCCRLFGPLRGTQPKGGTFTTRRLPQQLPGHPDCGTIEIVYHFNSGIQSQEHPNPGQPYGGTTRCAYLPANREGDQLCSLLKRAFDANLVFTVGRSITTGADNVVIWNDIHHKTAFTGPFGYPDPTYLTRLKEELAAKGIVP